MKSPDKKKDLLLIVNEDSFFLSHRQRVAELALEKGWNVTIAAKDTGKRPVIELQGFNFIPLPINPTGMNFSEEIKLLYFLVKLFRQNPNAVIHLVGLKNMLWGGLASKIVGKQSVLFAVSGLGTLFGEKKSDFISNTILNLLKFGIKGKNRALIFQNKEDEALFRSKGICKDVDTHYIKGSGVSLKEFSVPKVENNSDKLRVIFTGRMLKEKGIEDLISAAELLRNKYEEKVEFLLCGDITENKDSFTKEELEKLCDGNYVKWVGFREDIPFLLMQSDVMCFPSYYREGVPKSLLEASAASLPIITTDSVGCRDTVENNKNGFLVPIHSPESLAVSLERLIENRELRLKMGSYSRKKAEREYDVEEVARRHLSIYESLL